MQAGSEADDLPRVGCFELVQWCINVAYSPLNCVTQVLLENYLLLAAAMESQNAGRLGDMLQ